MLVVMRELFQKRKRILCWNRGASNNPLSCSKAISKYGAHNQRGVVRVRLRNEGFFWIEDVISMIEACASSGVYSVLKREDEKYVTEKAYENPRFVEDLVREVYQGLVAFESEKKFSWFSVEAENYESIHFHNAYAYTEFLGDRNDLFFETYGCQMNIAESASVERAFIEAGWTKADDVQVADFVIINTCSVEKQQKVVFWADSAGMHLLRLFANSRKGQKTMFFPRHIAML